MSFKLLSFAKNLVSLINFMSSGQQILKLPILKLIRSLQHRYFAELLLSCNKNPRLAEAGIAVHIVHRIKDQIHRLILRNY